MIHNNPPDDSSLALLAAAEQVFLELFGIAEAIKVRPLFLKNRTLTVTCSASAIVQEIRLNQAKIVEKINEKIGKNEVDRIRYLV
jgi:predicted nucleic acid-binding Zn ribbon protein